MAYRDAPSPQKKRETFTYVPEPRGCVAWLVDLGVAVAIMTLALHVARKDTVSCSWPERSLGQCDMTTENAVGMVTRRSIPGIHSLAYRTGREIGFVTDASNKDRDVPFATRGIEMWDDASAEALETFGSERGEPTFFATRGPRSPTTVGASFFVLLAIYVAVTRRAAYALTIDRGERMLLFGPRAWFGTSRRFELASVRGIDVENADIARHRVRLVLGTGEHVPLTRSFSPGAHHRAFADEVARALVG
jgi:hypothetical protein